jgi:cytoskeletal protein CcmA (bactofilin family)
MANTGGATIADGARFDGTYKGGELTVLGHFEGLLELSGRLQLGPQGCVKGIVEAAAAQIEGEFEGELRADKLAFGASARAGGVFHAPCLSMREGARVDGALNVDVAPSATVPAPHVEAAPQASEPRAAAPAQDDDEDAAACDDDDDAPAASAGEAAAMSA